MRKWLRGGWTIMDTFNETVPELAAALIKDTFAQRHDVYGNGDNPQARFSSTSRRTPSAQELTGLKRSQIFIYTWLHLSSFFLIVCGCVLERSILVVMTTYACICFRKPMISRTTITTVWGIWNYLVQSAHPHLRPVMDFEKYLGLEIYSKGRTIPTRLWHNGRQTAASHWS